MCVCVYVNVGMYSQVDRERGRERERCAHRCTHQLRVRTRPLERSRKQRREDAAEHACCGDAKSKDFLRTQGGKCMHGQRQEISMNIQMNLSMHSERSRQDTQQDMHAFFCLVFRTPNPRCAQDPPYVYVYRYICIYVHIYVCGMYE